MVFLCNVKSTDLNSFRNAGFPFSLKRNQSITFEAEFSAMFLDIKKKKKSGGGLKLLGY